MNLIDEFINWAKDNNWNIIPEKNDINKLIENKTQKVNIPDEYKIFLENIKICINNEQTEWFICINDCLEESRSSFIWDEYKNICFQYPWNEENEIKYYFIKIFPIIINVKSNYNFFGNFKYYGINTETNEIVVGYGIGNGEELEGIKVVSNNFEMFLTDIINGKILI